MLKLIKRVRAALATRISVYETRVRLGNKLFVHKSFTFGEALSWAKMYPMTWGVATIWCDGQFIAARSTEQP